MLRVVDEAKVKTTSAQAATVAASAVQYLKRVFLSPKYRIPIEKLVLTDKCKTAVERRTAIQELKETRIEKRVTALAKSSSGTCASLKAGLDWSENRVSGLPVSTVAQI